MDNFAGSGKYNFTAVQNETLKEWDRSIRIDIAEIIDEWRIVDLLCEVQDLVKELADVSAPIHAKMETRMSPAGDRV